MQHTNEVIEFADKYLFKERHGYNNSVINPVSGMVKLTGLSRDTVSKPLRVRNAVSYKLKFSNFLKSLLLMTRRK
ncbi:ATPase [Vibrio parahaemolyticus]|uniref:ATPase n=1 Tax=Vibrio parahaemolyticus TaxID=670 RepID=UPI00226A8097|nr:ATPase [Vibrio parahaemolyticus]MCX8758010.1 ATPase [Vibrio parahaemolyticus]